MKNLVYLKTGSVVACVCATSFERYLTSVFVDAVHLVLLLNRTWRDTTQSPTSTAWESWPANWPMGRLHSQTCLSRRWVENFLTKAFAQVLFWCELSCLSAV